MATPKVPLGPYIERVGRRPALFGPSGLYEGFTIDLPSYWKIRAVTMLEDPSTYAAQAILTVTGILFSMAFNIFWAYTRSLLARHIRNILIRTTGFDPDYITPELKNLIAEFLMRLVTSGFTSALIKTAEYAVGKLADYLATRIAEIVGQKLEGKVSSKLAAAIQTIVKIALRDILAAVLSKLGEKLLSAAIGATARLSPEISVIKFTTFAAGIIADLALQTIIECAIDTAEFLLWPTRAVGRRLGVGLMGGPNILSTLRQYYGFKFSKYKLAIYAPGWKPGVRGPWPKLTNLPTSGTRRLRAYLRATLPLQLSTDDLADTPRIAGAVPTPKVDMAARLGSVARFFDPRFFNWTFTGMVKRLVGTMETIGVAVQRSKGSIKVYTGIPLIGPLISEAIARNLITKDIDVFDALQGYYYATLGPSNMPTILGSAALPVLYRQAYALEDYIHYALKEAGANDWTTPFWSPP